MTTLELYRKHKKGEIGRDRFLYEVRRDKNLPWVTNITSYDDAVKILKNKGIIREAQFEPQNIPTDPLVDRVNPYALKREVEKLLAKEPELTNDSYKLALNKAAKKLTTPEGVKKAMFANADTVAKADAKLQMTPVKKNNLKDKANEMKKAKGQAMPKATAAPTKENKKTKKPKGVEVMKDKGVEGTEKVLRETALAELQSFLKKKLSLSEDVHNEYHVGSEVHLPEGGTGKIIEITGGTCTVEVADGSHRDIQMNVLGHAKKKAMEAEAAKTEVTNAITRSKWDPANEESYNIKVGDTVEVQAPHRYQGLKGRVTSIDDNRIEVEFNQEDVNQIGAYDTIETFDADQLDKINDADSVNEVRDMGYIEGSELANKLVDTIEMYNELTPEQRQEEIDRLGMDIIPKLKSVFNDIMNKIHDESNYPAQEDEMDEAQKFKASGETIFKSDTDAPGYEADLKKAGVRYTKTPAK